MHIITNHNIILTVLLVVVAAVSAFGPAKFTAQIKKVLSKITVYIYIYNNDIITK